MSVLDEDQLVDEAVVVDLCGQDMEGGGAIDRHMIDDCTNCVILS